LETTKNASERPNKKDTSMLLFRMAMLALLTTDMVDIKLFQTNCATRSAAKTKAISAVLLGETVSMTFKLSRLLTRRRSIPTWEPSMKDASLTQEREIFQSS